MKKKLKNKKLKVIIPIRKKCFNCGKKVTSHHFLCNKCHAKKQKADYWTSLKKKTKHNKCHKIGVTNA